MSSRLGLYSLDAYFVADLALYIGTLANDTFDIKNTQITDNKNGLSDQEIDILKQIKLSNVVFIVPEMNDGYFADTFTLFDSADNTRTVTLSNRSDNCGELRGNRVRGLLLAAKDENDNQSVYDAISEKSMRLRYHAASSFLNRMVKEKNWSSDVTKDIIFACELVIEQFVAQVKKEKLNISSEGTEISDNINAVFSDYYALKLLLNDMAQLIQLPKNRYTSECNKIMTDLQNILKDFTDSKLDFDRFKAQSNAIVTRIQQASINKDNVGFKYVLNKIAFILLSALSLGSANLIHYKVTGSASFFRKASNQLHMRSVLNEADECLQKISQLKLS